MEWAELVKEAIQKAVLSGLQILVPLAATWVVQNIIAKFLNGRNIFVRWVLNRVVKSAQQKYLVGEDKKIARKAYVVKIMKKYVWLTWAFTEESLDTLIEAAVFELNQEIKKGGVK